MMRVIYALYEQVSKQIRVLRGLSKVITNTVAVKQGYPLSSTSNEVVNYTTCARNEGMVHLFRFFFMLMK